MDRPPRLRAPVPAPGPRTQLKHGRPRRDIGLKSGRSRSPRVGRRTRPARFTNRGDHKMKRLFAAAVAVLAFCAATPVSAVQPEPDLAAVRAAAERFRDVNVALAEGYVRDPLNLCDTAAMMGRPAELGAMG